MIGTPLGKEGSTTIPVTIENLPDRDFGAGCQQAPDKLPTISVLFNVGIVKILKCDSLYVEYYCGSTEDLSASESCSINVGAARQRGGKTTPS